MIKVRECTVAHHIDSLDGLYVRMTGTYDELSILGKDKAKMVAKENGFNPEGKVTSGYPVSYNANTYTKAYWFFDKR